MNEEKTHKKSSILLIEEDETCIVRLTEALGGHFNFHVSKNVKDIHDRVNKRAVNGAVLSLDITEAFNSFDLLRDIRRSSKLPVVVISNNKLDDIRIAMRFGASDFCMKPIDLDYLQSKLSELVSF